jgi:hypothetical protein
MGFRTPPKNLTLKVGNAMFVETLDNLQHSTRCVSEMWNHTLKLQPRKRKESDVYSKMELEVFVQPCRMNGLAPCA